jgi:hypothetical protein
VRALAACTPSCCRDAPPRCPDPIHPEAFGLRTGDIHTYVAGPSCFCGSLGRSSRRASSDAEDFPRERTRDTQAPLALCYPVRAKETSRRHATANRSRQPAPVPPAVNYRTCWRQRVRPARPIGPGLRSLPARRGLRFGDTAAAWQAAKRTKLFVFSDLRVPRSRRHVDTRFLHMAPGPLTWAPVLARNDFLTPRRDGPAALVWMIRRAARWFGPFSHHASRNRTVTHLRTRNRLHLPDAIVATVPRRTEAPTTCAQRIGKFSEAVRRNLLKNTTTVWHGRPATKTCASTSTPSTSPATRSRRHQGKSLQRHRAHRRPGSLHPDRIARLMQVGWETGLGSRIRRASAWWK